MQIPSTTDAKSHSKNADNLIESTDINLYFGIFFDGTGANKFQMMLGKKFRRDKLFEKYKDQLKVEGINNGHDILKKNRAFWEEKKFFTVSELDQLYFDHDEEYKIEKRIIENCSTTDNDEFPKGIASLPNDTDTTTLLGKVATELVDGKTEEMEDYAESLRGTPAEDSSYTNIAILESCYQCPKGKQENDYYIPIYVEGSGSDMQFAETISAHTFGHILEGFAKAKGYAGVTAKITKMVKMINREILKKGINKKVKIVFDVFGFSRGATEARIFNYIATESCKSAETLKKLCGNKKPFQNEYVTLKEKPKVRFLGIYDTVSSIGSIRNLDIRLYHLIGNTLPNIAKDFELKDIINVLKNKIIDNDVKDSSRLLLNVLKSLTGISSAYNIGTLLSLGLEYAVESQESELVARILSYLTKLSLKPFVGSLEYHDQNVYDYGLYATDKAESVFHICALDEFRRNFALVDIESSINKNGLELFIPGCHGDIGGAPGIGRDGKKQIDKKTKEEVLFNGGPKITPKISTWWPSTKLFSSNAVYYQSSFEGLQKVGIINSNRINKDLYSVIKKKKYRDAYIETSLTTETDQAIELYRYVKPGYSNIALHLMFDRIKIKIGENQIPFASFLPLCYNIPTELKEYYNKINEDCIKKDGRYFVDPDEETYQWLRQNYLHFTSNCEPLKGINLQDCYTTNGPSYFEQAFDSSKLKNDGSLSKILSPYYHITPFQLKLNISDLNNPIASTYSPDLYNLYSIQTPQITDKPEYYFEAKKTNETKIKSAFVSRIIYSGEKTTRPSNSGDYDWTFMCDYKPKEKGYHVIPINESIDISKNIKPVINTKEIEEEIATLQDKINELERKLNNNINRGYVNNPGPLPTIIPNQNQFTYQQIKSLESRLKQKQELLDLLNNLKN